MRMPCAHARGPKLPPRACAMRTTRRRVGWSYHQQQDPAGGERTSARTSFVMPESSYPCTSSNPLNVERTDAASSSSHARDPSHVRRVRAERPLSSHDRSHAVHTALTHRAKAPRAPRPRAIDTCCGERTLRQLREWVGESTRELATPNARWGWQVATNFEIRIRCVGGTAVAQWQQGHQHGRNGTGLTRGSARTSRQGQVGLCVGGGRAEARVEPAREGHVGGRGRAERRRQVREGARLVERRLELGTSECGENHAAVAWSQACKGRVRACARGIRKNAQVRAAHQLRDVRLGTDRGQAACLRAAQQRQRWRAVVSRCWRM